MNTKFKFTIYDISIVGVMAAICFVTTYFIKIEIPSPAGPVMLKAGNIFCLVAGLVFGGLRGGLAAGIGSMLYDLLDPKYITDAPFTLIRFFLMAFICGWIAFMGNKKGNSIKLNIIGAVVGSLFSVAFYITKSVITLMLAGSEFIPAIVACSTKIVTSSINAIIAVIFACLLAPAIKAALKRSGMNKKLAI